MSVFRKEYRALNEWEKSMVEDIKATADLLHGLLQVSEARRVGQREMSLARTKLEECVMWAVKGVTG